MQSYESSVPSGDQMLPQVQARQFQRYLRLKRIGDVLCAALGLMFLAPLLAVVAIAIRVESKGPALFRQVRIGRNGKPFTMYKFRSMCNDAHALRDSLMESNERDGPVFKIKSDPRITRVGAVIRKLCVDELPQLINVLKGDMSLVGPRPPLPEEVERYTPSQRRRLEATPGLTCLWQVSDRDMSFDEWVGLDVEYIRNQSAMLDLKIILRTFAVVVSVAGDQ